jgi:DNA-binding CsgD family transcriptional regulator
MSTIPNRRKNSRNEVSAELAAATRAVEEDCHQRMAKIRQNARMKDILQLKEVTLNEQMRPLMMQNRALYQLEAAAELRIREILDGHLVELRAQRDLSALEQLRSHFLHREWSHLKGVYPLMFRTAEVEAEKLVVRLEYEFDSKRRKKNGR